MFPYFSSDNIMFPPFPQPKCKHPASCYYNYNIDDCLRRGITSLENYFIYLGILGTVNNGPFRSKTFLAKLKELVSKDIFIFPTTVADSLFKTLWLIYMIRNKIVHEKFRLGQDEKWICPRMIYALYNLYNNQLNRDKDISMYMVHLNIQFTSIMTCLDKTNLRNNHSLALSDEELNHFVSKFKLQVPQILM